MYYNFQKNVKDSYNDSWNWFKYERITNLIEFIENNQKYFKIFDKKQTKVHIRVLKWFWNLYMFKDYFITIDTKILTNLYYSVIK